MKLDFTNKACPIPVMQSKNALLASAPGEQIEIIVDNEAAAQNITRLLNAMNQPFEQDGWTFSLQRASELKDPFEQDAASSASSSGADTTNFPKTSQNSEILAQSEQPNGEEVLFLKSQRIGDGELGGMLAVGFLTAASSRQSLRKVILVNDAVLIACESSHPAHAALGALEAAGVEIICCANCLNYFGIEPIIGRAGDAMSIIHSLFNGRVLSL